MTNDEINPNDEVRNAVACRLPVIRLFELRYSFDIRHSCFVILVS
jgi:hypothetical protein